MKSKIHERNNGIENAVSKTSIKIAGVLLATALLSSSAATAQNKEQATVHIKKVEIVNGVKTVTDTTYTTNDPGSIIINDGTIDIIGQPGEEKRTVKTIIRSKDGDMIVSDEAFDKQMQAEIRNAMKEAGIDENGDNSEKVVIVNGKDGKACEGKQVIRTETIMVRVDIKDANEGELKRLGQNTGNKEQKLKLSDMSFYPNPNNGKFNLGFNLPDKGDTEVTILNSDGKTVYSEKLPAFSGKYDKEIDISKQAKGIYFVKVEQGKNSQVKKIVLE